MYGENEAFGDEEAEVGDEAGETESANARGQWEIEEKRNDVHVGTGEADAAQALFGVEANSANKVGGVESG